MCGRFVSASPPDEIAKYFSAEPPAESLAEGVEPNYNVAPTTDVFVVLADGSARRVAAHHWGLVPFWAKDVKVGNRMINARAETLATSGAFKHAFKHRRCIVPADGFYEWRKIPGQKAKQPFFIHRPDDESFAFAGLWEEWKGGGEGERLRSTTIVTTTPNEAMARIHDRMPVILPATAWDAWLDPENDDIETLGKLLVPAPSSLTVMHPVGTEVNNVRNGGPHLMDEAVDAAVAGGTLFAADGP